MCVSATNCDSVIDSLMHNGIKVAIKSRSRITRVAVLPVPDLSDKGDLYVSDLLRFVAENDGGKLILRTVRAS